MRITPAGPEVEIRSTGPPGTGADSAPRRTRPAPPAICTATPLGTRTSIEPQVSRWRSTCSVSQLAVVRSIKADPTPVLIVVSAASCHPGPSWRPPSAACRTRGLVKRRAEGVSRTNGGSACIADSRSTWPRAAKSCSRTARKHACDSSPAPYRSRSRPRAASLACSSTLSGGAADGNAFVTGRAHLSIGAILPRRTTLAHLLRQGAPCPTNTKEARIRSPCWTPASGLSVVWDYVSPSVQCGRICWYKEIVEYSRI